MMTVKTLLLAGIIAAGAGVLFVLVVGWRWWREMKKAKDPYREIIEDEGGLGV